MLIYFAIFTVGFYLGVMIASSVFDRGRSTAQEEEMANSINPDLSYIKSLGLKVGKSSFFKSTPSLPVSSIASSNILTP